MFNRRDFFYALGTCGLGGLMGAILAVPGVKYLLNPLGTPAQSGGFLPLGSLAELTARVPRLVPILGERRDAWVKYPREPIGAVWLVRQPDGAKEPVIALTAQCPHAGCPVELAADARAFKCPCHNSLFALDGARQNPVSPRGMDRLEVEPIDPSRADAEVRVRFRRFHLGTTEKIPLA